MVPPSSSCATELLEHLCLFALLPILVFHQLTLLDQQAVMHTVQGAARDVAAPAGKAAGATGSGLWPNPSMTRPPSSNGFRLIAREIKNI